MGTNPRRYSAFMAVGARSRWRESLVRNVTPRCSRTRLSNQRTVSSMTGSAQVGVADFGGAGMGASR
jgi:hypothetical protein